MRRPPVPILSTLAVVAAIPSLALARQALGGDPRAGAAVFKSVGCASCHTLRAAGATGKIGPNLDRLKPTTAQVAAQVRTGGGAMPPFAGQLSPKQIADVAAFVAAASRGGKLGGKTKPAPPVTPRALFRATCGSCHTLAAAGTNGRIGPNLDDESPSYDKVIEQMIEGDPPMPSFRGTLSRAQMAKVATYVSLATKDD